MSSAETTPPAKSAKTEQFVNWREQPTEIKIMDLATFAWLALTILNVILAFFIDLRIRTFPMFFLPLFMFVVTVSLRLRLVDKPTTTRNTFIVWLVMFVIITIASILVVALYPGVIGA